MNIFEMFGKFDLVHFISIIVITIVLYTFYKEKKANRIFISKRKWINKTNKTSLLWTIIKSKISILEGHTFLHPKCDYNLLQDKLNNNIFKDFIFISNEIVFSFVSKNIKGRYIDIRYLYSNWYNVYSPDTLLIKYVCTNKEMNNKTLIVN